jgi:hypothetical protein
MSFLRIFRLLFFGFDFQRREYNKADCGHPERTLLKFVKGGKSA